MGLSVWRGKFNKTSGKIIIDRPAKTGTVDVVVDPVSINFGLDKMDEKARSEDFFNVAKFHTATYRPPTTTRSAKASAITSRSIHRTVEAILKGQRRVLITMATGTGKTVVAFLICWKP